jgi:nitrogen regulatory protein P-II 1
MKEIKAYVHANRIGAVIAALKNSAAWDGAVGEDTHNLTVYVVKGSLVPVDARERHYSVELGEEVVNEYKLELTCADQHADDLVETIRLSARTGQPNAGWVFVTDVAQAVPIS